MKPGAVEAGGIARDRRAHACYNPDDDFQSATTSRPALANVGGPDARLKALNGHSAGKNVTQRPQNI